MDGSKFVLVKRSSQGIFYKKYWVAYKYNNPAWANKIIYWKIESAHLRRRCWSFLSYSNYFGRILYPDIVNSGHEPVLLIIAEGERLANYKNTGLLIVVAISFM